MLKQIGKRPPEKPRCRCGSIRGPAIEVVKHRPHRITTRGQTAMVMLHLRQISVASFNRRRRPLKRLGMRRRPRVPTRQHLGFELAGAWMPLKRRFHRLEHARDLGLLLRVARAAKLLVPVRTGQQQVFSPLGPPWCHRQLCQILSYGLPPTVDQNRDAANLPLDLGQGVSFHR